ncbi:MAG: hypothetical protein IKP47_06255 [Ruminococcus sp.]|nr:hypothetical protein [Ruminococcus sp.]
MNTLTTRALVTLLSVLILVTIGSQIYYRVNDRHKTEEAVLCDINENIPFKGVIVRNENVVTYSGRGVFEYLYKDGSKVSVGSQLADVYNTTQDLLNKRLADIYSNRADMLEKAQNPGTAQYVQPETLNVKINSEYKKLLSGINSGDLEAVRDAEDELFLQSSIYTIISEQADNYAEEIALLRANAEKCLAGSQPKGSVESAQSGYFVSYCDGYEKKLDLGNIGNLNQSDIESVIKGENKLDNGQFAIGKMFDDYSCSIIAVIPADKRVVEGDTVRIQLLSAGSTYNAVVEAVKRADDDEHSIIILSCNRLDPDIVSSRVLSFELIFDNYKGIKVPRDAIRFKDGQKGVYVILGNKVTFKKIEVIYEGTDFVVSKNTSNEDYLLLYDQILLEAVSSQNGTADESSE